ncbi:MAG: hypothetical protein ABL888_14765 [Pirellulaceae bacterium]
MPLWLIYCNPIVLTVASLGYFSPFFLPVVPGGLTGVLVANLLLLFLVSGLFAWLIAGGQVILGIIEFRKGKLFWKHHLASALWTFTCYAIVITLMSNGYLLTA